MVDGKGDRYYNRKLFHDDFITTVKYVGFKFLETETLLKEGFTLCLTEGIFDALQVLNLNKKNKNIIVLSINGKNYLQAILYMIRNGFYNIDEILIYSDDDVPHYMFINIQRQFDDIPISLFYNAIGKDFGVEKSLIELKEVSIT
jgi:hypothetical protein